MNIVLMTGIISQALRAGTKVMCDFIKTVKTNTSHHTPTKHHTTALHRVLLKTLLAIVISGNTSYRANRDHSNL
jgi:hypothetical protein